MQSLWQDVRYYFIFVISFLDVNIVVNTNLYLNITVRLLPFSTFPAFCSITFRPAECSQEILLFGHDVSLTESFCVTQQTSRVWRASVISERKSENHLWEFLMLQGDFLQGGWKCFICTLQLQEGSSEWSTRMKPIGNECEFLFMWPFDKLVTCPRCNPPSGKDWSPPSPRVWEKWNTLDGFTYQSWIVKMPQGFHGSLSA